MEDKMHERRFLVAYYRDTHLELVEEKTQRNGQMGSERQQGGVHIGVVVLPVLSL